MDIEVSRETLVKELALARRLGERKSTIPVYSYALLNADFGEVGIAATDGDSSLETGCAATVHTAGRALVPVKTLHDMLKAATAETARIISEGDRVTVKVGSFKSKLGVLGVEQFPDLAVSPKESIDVASWWFARGLDKTRFISEAAATSTNEYMRGALFSIADGKARLVSTDGHRLALAETALKSETDTQVVLPRKSLDDLAALLSADDVPDAFGFAQDDARAFFQIGVRRFVSRVLATKFPPYERIIPKDCDHGADVPREQWLSALRRVMLVSTEEAHRVRLTMADGAVAMMLESRLGVSDESIAAELDGDWIASFDVRYLVDFLAVADGASVKFEHKGGRYPAKLSSIFPSSGNEMAYTYVVSPMADAMESAPAPKPVAATV